MIHEGFMQTVLQLLANDSSIVVFKKVVNLLKKILQSSNHAKLICNVKFQQLMQPDVIGEKDLAFLRHIIDFAYSLKEKYAVSTQEMFSIEGDAEEAEKAVFAHKLTHLINALSQNYEFILITPHN